MALSSKYIKRYKKEGQRTEKKNMTEVKESSQSQWMKQSYIQAIRNNK